MGKAKATAEAASRTKLHKYAVLIEGTIELETMIWANTPAEALETARQELLTHGVLATTREIIEPA